MISHDSTIQQSNHASQCIYIHVSLNKLFTKPLVFSYHNRNSIPFFPKDLKPNAQRARQLIVDRNHFPCYSCVILIVTDCMFEMQINHNVDGR